MQEVFTLTDEKLKVICKTCKRQILSVVMKNSGSTHDAEDIFQETMMAFFLNVRNGKYEPNAGICTYLYSIARNRWFKELRRRKNSATDFVDEVPESADDPPVLNETDEMKIQLNICLEKMGEPCKTIMVLHSHDVSDKEAAKQLSFESERYYRIRKMRCKEKLITCMKKQNTDS